MDGLFSYTKFFSGIVRIRNATKVIFENLKIIPEKNVNKSELWNALKNIFRGIIALIPFTGISLIVFDSIRSAIHISNINTASNHEEDIAGIAMNGKIIFTIDLLKLDHIIIGILPPNTTINENRLAVFIDLSLKFLKKIAEKGDVKIEINEIFPKMTPIFDEQYLPKEIYQSAH